MTTEETGSTLPENESEQNKALVPAKSGDLEILCYDVKEKKKNVLMHNAVLSKTAKGAVIAKGVAENGNKLTTLMALAKANACVEAGIATKTWE